MSIVTGGGGDSPPMGTALAFTRDLEPPPPQPGPVPLRVAGAELLAWMHRRAAREGELR